MERWPIWRLCDKAQTFLFFPLPSGKWAAELASVPEKRNKLRRGHAAVPVPPYPQGVGAFEWNGARGGTDAGPERDTLCAG